MLCGLSKLLKFDKCSGFPYLIIIIECGCDTRLLAVTQKPVLKGLTKVYKFDISANNCMTILQVCFLLFNFLFYAWDCNINSLWSVNSLQVIQLNDSALWSMLGRTGLGRYFGSLNAFWVSCLDH